MMSKTTGIIIAIGIVLFIELMSLTFKYIPKSVFLIIIPILLLMDLFIIVKSLIKGRSFPTFFTSNPYSYGEKIVYKKDKPVRFWILIFVQIVAAVLLSGIFLILLYY